MDYIKASVEINYFENEDVICTSGIGVGDTVGDTSTNTAD